MIPLHDMNNIKIVSFTLFVSWHTTGVLKIRIHQIQPEAVAVPNNILLKFRKAVGFSDSFLWDRKDPVKYNEVSLYSDYRKQQIVALYFVLAVSW
jgi:hypothetical protein